MPLTRRAFLAFTCAAGAATATLLSSRPAAETGQDPLPQTQSGSTRQEVRFGQQPLKLGSDRDGLLYVPRGYKPDVPAPLMVTLHGAGGTGLSATSMFPLADEFGIVVLAPDSRDERSWDVVLGGYGPDVEFIRAALDYTMARCTIDRKRIALVGVSDGASYALSLGIGNGDFFSRIIAFSPGLMRPAEANGKPRVFISHGTSDNVMPIDITSRDFVKRLKALGYDVTYREFDGGHRTPPAVVREAFEWFAR